MKVMFERNFTIRCVWNVNFARNKLIVPLYSPCIITFLQKHIFHVCHAILFWCAGFRVYFHVVLMELSVTLLKQSKFNQILAA